MKEKQPIKSFKDLHAWREGHTLVLLVYRLTKKFPKEELFGIVSQMRRAVVSVTSNIAEGFGRNSYKEKAQFYSEEFIQAEEQLILVQKILAGLAKSSRNFF